jgi:hypothetical protein
MNYAVEMRSGAMIHIPRYISIFRESKICWGGYTYRHTQQGDLMSLLLFFYKIWLVGLLVGCRTFTIKSFVPLTSTVWRISNSRSVRKPLGRDTLSSFKIRKVS